MTNRIYGNDLSQVAAQVAILEKAFANAEGCPDLFIDYARLTVRSANDYQLGRIEYSDEQFSFVLDVQED